MEALEYLEELIKGDREALVSRVCKGVATWDDYVRHTAQIHRLDMTLDHIEDIKKKILEE